MRAWGNQFHGQSHPRSATFLCDRMLRPLSSRHRCVTRTLFRATDWWNHGYPFLWHPFRCHSSGLLAWCHTLREHLGREWGPGSAVSRPGHPRPAQRSGQQWASACVCSVRSDRRAMHRTQGRPSDTQLLPQFLRPDAQCHGAGCVGSSGGLCPGREDCRLLSRVLTWWSLCVCVLIFS